MYPVLILREEIVCLIILIFLCFTSRMYRMGKDSAIFSRILFLSLIHVIFDIITVLTVNHTDTVPAWINYSCHIVFYVSAIFYSKEICDYVFKLCYPLSEIKFPAITFIPPVIYLIMLPFLSVEYHEVNGTYASVGSAAVAGYALAFLYFLYAFVMIFMNYRKLSRLIINSLLPMLLILVISETIQVVVKDFLFTGGAVTIVTVGFFFSLENPAHVFEQKAMTDALTGLKSRHGFEEEIIKMDAKFKAEPSEDFIFAYCDINNLRSVNESFGHHEGDNYITFIANTLSQYMIHARSIFRMGGDEFLAVYYRCSEDIVKNEIREISDRCRKESGDKGYVPSIAAGYAVSSSGYKSLKDVIRTADYLMFKNKAAMHAKNSFVSSSAGTKLNLSGLTDRLFNAMCVSSNRTYPFVTNLETDVTRVAPAWKQYFDLEDEYLVNFFEVWQKYIHPDDVPKYISDVTAVLSGKQKYYVGEFNAITPDGQYVKCSCNGAIYHGNKGEPDIFTGYMINHGVLETVDAITGLPNFIQIDEYIQNVIDRGERAILIKMGINQFSRINMLYGYLGGDTILKNLAFSIQDAVSEEGKVFCQDGSNFTIFLPDCTREHATEIYNLISSTCASGINIGKTSVPLNISGGAFEINPLSTTDRKAVRSSLLYALDESVYQEHSRLVFYDENRDNESNAELNLLSEIYQDAVADQKYFELRYQQIVDNSTGKTVGAEALLRWVHPKYGVIMPGRFISFLENDPCYYNLGLNIINRALNDCIKFRSVIPNFRVSVNITALQLQHDNFVSNVYEMIERKRLPPDCLVLELTERCKELDTGFLKNKINEIRNGGIHVAFDDMGTGYSTVGLLMTIPVDEIKLDHLFVKQLMSDPKYQVFVDALVKGADLLHYSICFEGIETEDMMNFVKNYGNFFSQGYYFSMPILADEFIKQFSHVSL